MNQCLIQSIIFSDLSVVWSIMLRSRLARKAQMRKNLVDQQLANAAANAAAAAAAAGLQDDNDDHDRDVPASREATQETSQISSVFQRNFNRPSFDIQDPGKSVSRHFLLPVQKSSLINWLYREEGRVSCAMVVQLGAYFNVRLDSADVETVLGSGDAQIARTGDGVGWFREKSRQKNDFDDIDSEPDPDEPAATKNTVIGSSSGFSYGQFYGLVWLLKKELHALYRDVMKRENNLKTDEESVSNRLDVPSYTQQRCINFLGANFFIIFYLID